ncbi:MAG: hypothetical protein LUD22_01825 [Coprobacillus sp.]|nr:hypothetical protein [Coprobacillus sp.]
MAKLEKLLKTRKSICFLDLEGTQYSHECIALGAEVCTLNKNGSIRKKREPFKVYVKPKNKIGKYIETLTGITDKFIEENGVSFKEAIEKFFKYLGSYGKGSLYITYGSHDMTILNQTIAYNLDAPMEKCKVIQKNYLDFQTIFNEYVKDDQNNVLSLVHACELFECLDTSLKPHDPENDAIQLANLYQALYDRKDILFERYKKVLAANSKLPSPIAKLLKDINDGKIVDSETYDKYIHEEIEHL